MLCSMTSMKWAFESLLEAVWLLCRRDGRAVLLVAPSMSRALNGN
jgi:hypothetical protein